MDIEYYHKLMNGWEFKKHPYRARVDEFNQRLSSYVVVKAVHTARSLSEMEIGEIKQIGQNWVKRIK